MLDKVPLSPVVDGMSFVASLALDSEASCRTSNEFQGMLMSALASTLLPDVGVIVRRVGDDMW